MRRKEEIKQCYAVGFDPDSVVMFSLLCWQFLNYGVVDFHFGDLDLLSGGRVLFPEHMLVALIVSVLLFSSCFNSLDLS